MRPPVPQLRPMDLGGLLDETIALYRQNFALFTGIVAVLTIPEMLLNIAVAQTSSITLTILNALITSIFGFLITGALAWAISQRYLGQPTSIGASYTAIGASTFLTLLAASIIAGIAVAIGFVLIIIPGIILLVRLAFMPEAVVLERRGVFDSLQRSWELVAGQFWRVLGYGFVILVIALVIEAVLGGVIGGILAAGGGGNIIRPVVTSIVSIFVEPFRLSAFVLLYYDLRIRKEGFDLEQMTRLLGSGAPA